jgi:ATP-binding protein involved in chromosome partitioning
MGLMGQRPTAIDQMFIPLESYGVKTVSMEMFKPERSDPVATAGRCYTACLNSFSLMPIGAI